MLSAVNEIGSIPDGARLSKRRPLFLLSMELVSTLMEQELVKKTALSPTN
jgi:hypothetical protein